MLYTIIPVEYIFEPEEADEDEPGKKDKDDDEEIKREGISLMVQHLSPGQAKITRIISTNPNDYLRPEWQPGSMMTIF